MRNPELKPDGSLLLATFPVVLSFIVASTIFFVSKHLPPDLPLFYSLPWGENQLAKTDQLIIIPAIFLCISLVNLIIFLQLDEKFIVLKRILSITSIIVSLILTASFFQIIAIFI